MNLLSFDTSSEVLSIAIFQDQKILVEIQERAFTRHSSRLVASLDQLLKRGKMKMEDVDCLTVGLGPGSFTGLRVGIVTAKILATVLKLKLIGVPSLAALAWEHGGEGERVAVALDARKNQWYAAIYEKTAGSFKTLQKPVLMDQSQFVQMTHQVARVIDGGKFYPNAKFIAQIAFREIQARRFTNPERMEPLYLHPKDCHVKK